MTQASDPLLSDRVSASIPVGAGVGFKAQYLASILEKPAQLAWLEVHPENYMVDGGPRHAMLAAARATYPLSLHGVGLSLGGMEPIDQGHLRAFRGLVDRYEPGLVSEHLAWSAHEGTYFADLLPPPLTKASLRRICEHVDQVQMALGRQILIENPANYLQLPQSAIPEVDFLTLLSQQSGCGLLIDVNNIFVSAQNLKWEALKYLDALPVDRIGEIHVSGHALDPGDKQTLIDDHGSHVAPAVWDLLAHLLSRSGAKPVLVEWDNYLPSWPEIYKDVQQADAALSFCSNWKDAG